MEEVTQSTESASTGAPAPALDTAVAAITEAAPKLSGLDKLKAHKDYVEKNDAAPPKTGAKSTNLSINGDKPPITGEKPLVLGAEEGSPPYTADFKYKAQGKELEIPEKFRHLITDKESEEELKTLFGKSHTVDEYKGQIDTFKKNLNEVGGALNQYQSGIQELRQIFAKGDLDTWFQKLNVPAEKIYQWVLDKVQYNQLPEAQRAQIDRQRDLQRQAEMAEARVGQVSHREMELATQVKSMQLEQTLGKADVKSMADAFDSRVGRPGAFKDAVIDHGKAIWALSQRDLTPEQAVADFVQKYGNPSAFAGQPPATEVASAPAITPPSANAQPPVKVIPNVAGRSTSPVKQGVRSIDDLKRLAKKATEEDNATRNPSQGYLAS